MLGNTTTVVGDINSYMASLRRLLELPNIKVLCPGHGPLIRDTDDLKARGRLEMYVAHREMRENQVLEQLEGGEPRPRGRSWRRSMATRSTSACAALRTQCAGASEVDAEVGRGESVARVRRTQRASTVERERTKQRERDTVIRKAKRFERDKQRRQIARQESAPTDLWKSAPSYQLKSKS